MLNLPYHTTIPLAFTKGKGVWLYDKKGQAYLDGVGGLGACCLGHSHPKVTKAIQNQAEKLIFRSNLFPNLEQEILAQKLKKLSSMFEAFFSNSKEESNETAIKLARSYGHSKGIETPQIIVMEGAFHGHTIATLTASGTRKIQAGFEPLLQGFIRAPYNNIEAIKRIALHRDDIVAVMLEPIQVGEGMQVADNTYLSELEEICHQKGWLLILDETQTGNGRTGNFFAFQYTGAKPDILTTGNGLGNGLPLYACLIEEKILPYIKKENAAFLLDGNTLSTTAALTVLTIIEEENLLAHAAKLGAYIKEQLAKKLANFKALRFIHGKGLLIGIELERPAQEVLQFALKNKLLISIKSENIIYLSPPLNITQEEVEDLLDRLCSALEGFAKKVKEPV